MTVTNVKEARIFGKANKMTIEKNDAKTKTF